MTRPGRGGRRPVSEPLPMGGLLGSVLDDLGLGSTSRVLRISRCWQAAVGEEVAQHARPSALRGRVLEVTVDSSVWCQQLQLGTPGLLDGLKRELGDDAPGELWFKVGVLDSDRG